MRGFRLLYLYGAMVPAAPGCRPSCTAPHPAGGLYKKGQALRILQPMGFVHGRAASRSLHKAGLCTPATCMNKMLHTAAAGIEASTPQLRPLCAGPVARSTA